LFLLRYMLKNKLSGAQQNLGGTKNLEALPLNAPLPWGWHKVKVTSKFQQICRLLAVEIVVSEQISYSDSYPSAKILTRILNALKAITRQLL